MEEESNFEREEISFINKIYGSSSAFYAFTCALVGVTILAGCLFNVLLRRYCRINICRGAHQRRPRGNDILGDEQLAAQVGLQFELDEAERNRKKMERRQERLIKYQRILQNFKMTVSDEDLIKPIRDNGSDPSTLEEGTKNESDPEQNILVLRSDKRKVFPACAVCMEEYICGDEVIWSMNDQCPHVFHEDCILTWLSKGKKRCPCCRQFYVKDVEMKAIEKHIDEKSDEEDEQEEEEEGDIEAPVERSQSPAIGLGLLSTWQPAPRNEVEFCILD
mmetsp:Transcript_461/g.772  ORF Transcript_461/g.772 Transcript_461/m.772 type:complete len:277 (-) Transcript_461:464-1294(-)